MTPALSARGMVKNPVVPILVILLAGCAGPEKMSAGDLLSQDSVVNTAPGGGAAPAEEAPALSEAEARLIYDKAYDMFLRGEYEDCLALVRDTLPDAPAAVASDLRDLRFKAKRKLLAQRVLEVRILPDRDVYAVGEEVRLQLALRNLARTPILVKSEGQQSSGSLFVLKAERQDWDVFGSVRTDEIPLFIPLKEDVSIPVAGRREFTETLPTGDPRTRHQGFSILRIGGVFRPAAIQAGEHRYYTAVEIKEAVVKLVPPGYEPIAEDPVGTLKKAWRLGFREHLLIAAELSPPERREEVMGILVGFLRGPSTPLTITAMAALRRVSGLNFGSRPQAWVEWWEERENAGN